MKKALHFIFSFAILVGISACEKNTYIEPENPNRTIFVRIPSANWSPNDDETVWQASADIDEIDAWIVDQGTVLADISFNNGKTYEPLSSIYNQQGYRFEYGLGYFIVDVQSTAKGDERIGRPIDALVKVLLIDSDLVD